MARKELAGLAALGALAMMANRSKKGADRDTDTGVDVQPSYAKSTPDLVGMSNMGDSSNTTGEYAPGPSSMMRPEPTIKPRPRPRPRLDTSSVKDMDLTGGAKADWNKVSPEEADRRKKMESAQALEAVRPEEAIIGGGFSAIKPIAALARGLANRKGAAKLSEYITPEIGMSRPMLPRPGQTYGEGFVMNRKNGGTVKMAKGGVTRSSASSRGDGIASKGKTRGRLR